MTLRSLFVAAVCAISLGSLADTADAKTRVHIGIGVGDPFYYRCRDTLIFDDCHRYGYFYGRPRYYGYQPYRPYRPNRFVDKLSCREARSELRSRGYRDISIRDCNGRYYSFNATRKGRPYRIRMDAITGGISRNRR